GEAVEGGGIVGGGEDVYVGGRVSLRGEGNLSGEKAIFLRRRQNLSGGKHPNAKAWMKRNKCFHVHFTPTSASWLNKSRISYSLYDGLLRQIHGLTEMIPPTTMNAPPKIIPLLGG